MSWAGLGNTDFVTNANILDAIGMAVITLKPGKSVSNNSNFITKAEANDKLNIAVLSGLGTDWPVKQDLMPLGWRGFIGVECLTNENRIHGTSVHFYQYDNGARWQAGMTIVSDLPFLSAQEIEVFDNTTGLFRIDTETYDYPMAHAVFTTVPGQILTGYMVIYDGPTIYRGVSSTTGNATVIPALIDGYAVSKEEIEVNTGYRGYRRLEQYNLITGNSVNIWKKNVPHDPDYIEPVYDPSSCPLPTNYHAVGGCYWLRSDDDYDTQACAINGNEVYYNTTGLDGWNYGDIVYEYVGGEYLPLSRNWDIHTALSFTNAGVRVWLLIEGFTSRIINSGTCAAISYYPISSGALIEWNNDEYDACYTVGSETFYITAFRDLIHTGDIVYKLEGGIYKPITDNTIDYSIVSYESYNSGTRAYAKLTSYGLVVDVGYCP